MLLQNIPVVIVDVKYMFGLIAVDISSGGYRFSVVMSGIIEHLLKRVIASGCLLRLRYSKSKAVCAVYIFLIQIGYGILDLYAV